MTSPVYISSRVPKGPYFIQGVQDEVWGVSPLVLRELSQEHRKQAAAREVGDKNAM